MTPPGSWRWAAISRSRYSLQVNALVSPLRPPVQVQPVHQAAALAGPVAGQPGDGDVPAPAAADADDRVIPRRAQVLDRGGLSDWPDSSSKTIQPPRAAAVLLPGARSPSSTPRWRRRPARWPGAPHLAHQPRRRSRYQTPGMVYCTPNLLATRSRTRASVHRWSSNPAASDPASSTDSSPASCCSSSRHGAAGPFDASPARPLASHACRQRRTDRSVTRSSAAISAAGTRCSNLSTAASWTCSRRLRPSAVKPPPCGYLIPPAYPRKPVSPTDIPN